MPFAQRFDAAIGYGLGGRALWYPYFVADDSGRTRLDLNTLRAQAVAARPRPVWLAYRTFSLQRPLRLTWRQLYRQFGVDPAKAQRILGGMYAEGRGVPPDAVAARMTPTDVREANRRAQASGPEEPCRAARGPSPDNSHAWPWGWF